MTAAPPWDLYRTFEAVVRTGTFGGAAKIVGASQSTVSRQLAALEQIAGATLLERTAPVRPTPQGQRLLAAIEPMVAAATAARVALSNERAGEGEVTVSATAEVVRWVLAAELPALFAAHPSLRLTVLASNALHSLAAGECDLAIRMVRPERGDLVSRRLTVESYGFFAATKATNPETPWVGLGGTLSQIPEQRHAARAFGRPARLLVEDMEALASAIAHGVGAGVLPRRYAARRGDVVEVTPAAVGAKDLGALPRRSIWLVVHRSKRNVPAVRAVARWLKSCFE